MYTDVHRFVKACPQCMLNSEIKSVTPMTDHPMTDAPGKVWIVDLLHLPMDEGYEHVLVCIDAFSRWLEIAPVKDTKSLTVAKALVETIITGAGGYMDLLISDSGSEFKREVTNVCSSLQIQQKYTAAHRAMGHGAVERVNRTVKDRIKAFAKEGKWLHRLQWAKLAYNSGVLRALSEGGTEMTPAEVHLGRQLRIPLEGLSLHKPAGIRNVSEYAESIMREMIEVKEHVIRSRAQYNREMKEQYEKSHIIKDRSFEPGDTVWVQRPPSEAPRNKMKLQTRNDGPMRVVSKDGPNEYTVQRLGGGVKTP